MDSISLDAAGDLSPEVTGGISPDAKEGISFADLGLDDVVLKAVEAKGFTEPTPIQVLAIPRLLSGDANVIAKARTGTGKTAAFGLPLIQELRGDKHCPRALVLVPTRELAVQVTTEIDSLRTETYPRTVTVYGGASIVDQLRKLRSGVEIVVGTPGRVIDHLERGSLDLAKIEYFILDEADEMLNMGFIEDIEAIFGRANPEARVLMFSATMPAQILSIASNFMGEYEIVEEEARPEEPVLTEQFYWLVREDDKTEALVRLIDSTPNFYGLVFCQTKADADTVAKELDERHYQAAALHGDIAQSQREKILGRFRSKKTKILVATDVAARGIDIEGLTHVVNYALPYDGPTYTHRIGRTGRAGSHGIAVTFVRPEDRRRLGYLKHNAHGELNEGKVPTINEVLEIKRKRIMGMTEESLAEILDAPGCAEGVSPKANDSATDGAPMTDAAAEAAAESAIAASTEDGADDGLGASCPKEGKALSPETKKLRRIAADFRSFADKLSEERDPREVLAAVLALQYGDDLSTDHYNDIKSMRTGSSDRTHIRLYVGIGRRDGLTRRGIAQFFRDLIGVPERLVDRIEVMDAFSLATLPADAANAALDLSRQRRNVPHMHVDINDAGGDFHSGPRPGFRSGFRGDRAARGPRGEGGYKGSRPEQSDRADRGGYPERGERFDRGSRGPRFDHGRSGFGDRPEGAVPPRVARTYSRGPKGEGAGYRGPAQPAVGGASAYKKKKRTEDSGE
jgi:ATP-dependent RNA helicase DeaD